MITLIFKNVIGFKNIFRQYIMCLSPFELGTSYTHKLHNKLESPADRLRTPILSLDQFPASTEWGVHNQPAINSSTVPPIASQTNLAFRLQAAMQRLRAPDDSTSPAPPHSPGVAEAPRSAFPAARFPLHCGNEDINRQLRDLLQRHPEKMWPQREQLCVPTLDNTGNESDSARKPLDGIDSQWVVQTLGTSTLQVIHDKRPMTATAPSQVLC